MLKVHSVGYTTLSLTIRVYLHSFSCCCIPNVRNPAQFSKNANLYSSKSSKLIYLGVNRKRIYNFQSSYKSLIVTLNVFIIWRRPAEEHLAMSK